MGYKMLAWVGIILTVALGVTVIAYQWLAPEFGSNLFPLMGAALLVAIIGVAGHRRDLQDRKIPLTNTMWLAGFKALFT